MEPTTDFVRRCSGLRVGAVARRFGIEEYEHNGGGSIVEWTGSVDAMLDAFDFETVIPGLAR